MKALVYHGPGKRLFGDKPRPVIKAPTDAIVRVSDATICGSDLRVMRGDTPRVAHGRILGHEGTGIVERVGDDVANFGVGDRVLISSLTSCGTCAHCRNGEQSRCESGGWMLGNSIDGTYAEFVRVPFADHSLFPIAGGQSDPSRGPSADGFLGGLIRDVFTESNTRTDKTPIVFGGPVGMGPVLAVMQYYRDVIHQGLPARGGRPHQAQERRRTAPPGQQQGPIGGGRHGRPV